MNTIFIVLGFIVALIIIWLLISALWISKQSLVGSWTSTLSDGSIVTLQFDGTPKGGKYKQLTQKGDNSLREFGHWTLTLTDLRMIIKATDVKLHPLFGQDTHYSVYWHDKDRIVINGPDRQKLDFKRADPGFKIEFDESTFDKSNKELQDEIPPDLLKLCLYLKEKGIVGPVDLSPPINEDMEYAMHVALEGEETKILSLIKCPNQEACERTYQDSLKNPVMRGQSKNGLFVMTLTFVPEDNERETEVKTIFENYVPE